MSSQFACASREEAHELWGIQRTGLKIGMRSIQCLHILLVYKQIAVVIAMFLAPYMHFSSTIRLQSGMLAAYSPPILSVTMSIIMILTSRQPNVFISQGPPWLYPKTVSRSHAVQILTLENCIKMETDTKYTGNHVRLPQTLELASLHELYSLSSPWFDCHFQDRSCCTAWSGTSSSHVPAPKHVMHSHITHSPFLSWKSFLFTHSWV